MLERSSILSKHCHLINFVAMLGYISIVHRYNCLQSDTRNNDSKLNNSPKPKSENGRLKLVLLVNFFPCTQHCNKLFAPVDQAQNVTFASMIHMPWNQLPWQMLQYMQPCFREMNTLFLPVLSFSRKDCNDQAWPSIQNYQNDNFHSSMTLYPV